MKRKENLIISSFGAPKRSFGCQNFVLTLLLVLSLLIANIAHAGDITGKVTVLERKGKKNLKSFENAVVYLEGIETPAPQEPALMDQQKKTFVPRLLPVVKGQEVQFLNSDKVRHNIFSPDGEESFDLGRFPKGETASVTLVELGPHKVYCDIHQKMVADVFVLPNQYFSVTDKEGQFVIKDVPDGEYTIKVWHILNGADEKTIRVSNAPLEVDFTITSKKMFRNLLDHKRKRGGSYKQSGSSSSSGSSY